MTDYILGVSDPKQWHSEVLICDGALCICVFDRPLLIIFVFHSILIAGFNQESEIEQASLCVMDGAPWWREPGTCPIFLFLLFLVSHV